MSVQDQATPYDTIGGSAAVKAIVDRFYDLMDSDARFAGLRALHDEDLSQVREGLASFLSGWLGGPRDWFGSGRCVMSLHGALAIPVEVAGQWSQAMAQAISEQAGLPADIARLMTERLDQVAHAMVNRTVAS